MVQQAYQKVLDHQVNIVPVICDATAVLVLLHIYVGKQIYQVQCICKVPVLSRLFLMYKKQFEETKI